MEFLHKNSTLAAGLECGENVKGLVYLKNIIYNCFNSNYKERVTMAKVYIIANFESSVDDIEIYGSLDSARKSFIKNYLTLETIASAQALCKDEGLIFILRDPDTFNPLNPADFNSNTQIIEMAESFYNYRTQLEYELFNPNDVTIGYEYCGWTIIEKDVL